ncbi:histidine kinase [Psychrobacter lutiphocae]|uniref:histidine kinase n=1 Tax=Psychrobacter lutiphocae TaxID=540500 RepID=UPI000368AD9B|nr:histidine kinase [Psychrobacter lutiphocae]
MLKTISNMLSDSLPTRAWLAVITVTFLFLMSAISSGYLAWVSQEDARAVNTAGSIRMATYRVNFLLASDFQYPDFIDLTDDNFDSKQPEDSRLYHEQAIDYLIKDMQRRLNDLYQYQSSHKNNDFEIDQQLKKIDHQWQTVLQPALAAQDMNSFYQASLTYIFDVDNLANQLQYRNEQRQKWQQILQFLSLILAVLVMLAGLIELKQKVLRPVNSLIKATKEFQRGHLDSRIPASGYREFNSLAVSFNDMAATIDSYQKSLEQEVAVKTANLIQANQVLSLLYDFARHLTTEQVGLTRLNHLISDFEAIIPGINLTLCLQYDALDSKDSIAIHGNKISEICASNTCDSCHVNLAKAIKSYPVAHRDILFGELRVRATAPTVTEDPNKIPLVDETTVFDNSTTDHPTPKNKLNPTEIDPIAINNEALIALTNLISTAMFLVQQRQHEHQIILLEERATIARELHDSLAQSLSYLKIQVAILEKRLDSTHCTSPEYAALTESIVKIKDGLNSAYQHLRDLLVTFRLSLDDDSFDEALHNSVQEFAEKGGFNYHINNQVMSLNLSASEQVNIIQIVREALSNICRHSQASEVAVNFQYVSNNSNETILTIADNGVGIHQEVDQTHHHGLMIMQERANSLNGQFQITENQPQGTIITIRFTPAFFQHETNE